MGRRDMVAMTKLLSDYSQKGEIDCARKLFDKMPHKDTVTYNIMIKCYTDNRKVGDARDLFDRMHDLRNTVSWNSIITAYTRERKTAIALKLFLIMPRKDVISWTTIVSGLCRDSQITDAYRLFSQMPEKNSVSWSSIISGFQQNGLAVETLSLFKEMLSGNDRIRPTSHSFTSALTASAELAALSAGEQLYSQVLKRGYEGNNLVNNSAITMFMKCGCVYNAKRLSIERPDIVTWNAMIMGYAQNGYGREAILTFHQMLMLEGRFRPDNISFLGVLQGCTHCGFVEEAFKYFETIQRDWGILPGPEHYACMVDVMARAGFVKKAYEMIMAMPFQPMAIFWRTLLNGCRMWGDVELGVLAASEVLKLEPGSTSACLMVIDMYICAGRFKEVAEIRKRMGERGLRKEVSCSWIEVQSKVHVFTKKDETHFETDNIYMILDLFYYCLVEKE